MMFDIFLLGIVGFITISFLWIWRISRTFFWLKKDIFLNNKASDRRGRFFVLLPVLDEALILEETVEYFSKSIQLFRDSKVVLITTEKEYQLNNLQSLKNTIVLSKVLEKRFDNVISLHYPYVEGKMAHQVNYAVNFIKNNSNIQKGDFFALYNADSRPDNGTFGWIHQYLSNNQKQAQVFQ